MLKMVAIQTAFIVILLTKTMNSCTIYEAASCSGFHIDSPKYNEKPSQLPYLLTDSNTFDITEAFTMRNYKTKVSTFISL